MTSSVTEAQSDTATDCPVTSICKLLHSQRNFQLEQTEDGTWWSVGTCKI